MRNKKVSRHLIIAIILFVVVLAIFSYSVVVPAARFWSINGTYQNYNVVRRLFDGQLPYKNFSLYLGLGHLYLGSLFTFIFGNNYTASVVAFSFLTVLSFSLTSICLGVARKRNLEFSVLVTAILDILLIVRPSFLNNMLGVDSTFVDSWYLATDMGGSARSLRSIVLPAAIMLYCSIRQSKRYSIHIRYFLIGLLAGCCVTFSNDYGIATAIVIMLYSALHALTEEARLKNKFYLFLCALTGFVVWLVLVIRVATGMSFAEWLSSQKGISDYQSWYYNQTKVYYVYQVKADIYSNIQGFIALYAIIRILRKEKDMKAEMIGGLNFAAWLVIQESTLLGGGGIEVARNILWLTIAWWGVDFFAFVLRNWSSNRKQYARILAATVCCAYIVSTMFFCFTTMLQSKYEDTDVTKQLGGHLYSNEKDVADAKAFLNDRRVFSTYASAVEDVTSQFQPTGYDYIIHVLGDAAREKYMQFFRRGQFDYVGIQRTSYTDWEYWIRNANWFFYRELYRWYEPVFQTDYERFYQRRGYDALLNMPEETEISTEEQEDGSFIVTIETDENVNGVADIEVDYETIKKDGLRSKLIFRGDVGVIELSENKYENNPASDYKRNFFLPTQGIRTIPVTIVNGKGEFAMNSNPLKDTELVIHGVKCNGYFLAPYGVYAAAQVRSRSVRIKKDSDSIALLSRTSNWIDIGDRHCRIRKIGETEDYITVYTEEKLEKTPKTDDMRFVSIY